MTIVKTLTANAKGKNGWLYAGAFVAVWQVSVSSQDTYTSEDPDGSYISESNVDTIAYRANFWPDEGTQKKGLASMPLFNSDSGLFTVDLEHEESIQVLNSALSPIDKHLRLIELDVQRMFA